MGRILLSWRHLHRKELKNNRTKWTNVVRVTKEYQREEWGGEYTNPSRTAQTLSNFKLPSMSKGNQHSSIVISSGGGYYPRDRVISGERPCDCEHIQVRRYSDPHCDSWGWLLHQIWLAALQLDQTTVFLGMTFSNRRSTSAVVSSKMSSE